MKKKNVNIEFLRVISIMLVILTHVLNINYLDWDGSIRPKVWLLNSLCITAVPCFFMITGYFSDVKQNPVRKISRTLTGVVLPTVAVGMVAQFLWPWLMRSAPFGQSLVSADIAGYLRGVATWRIEKMPGCTIYWYSTTYVQLMLMFPLLRLLCVDTKEARIGRLSVYALCMLKFLFADVSQLVYIPVKMYSPYDRSVLFFLMGYEARLIDWKRVPAAVLAAGLALGCAMMTGLTLAIFNRRGRFVDYFFHYSTLPCILTSVCMFALVVHKLRLPEWPKIEKAVCFLGGRVFTVYLTHHLFLELLRNRAPFWDNRIHMLLLLWLTTAALSFALASVLFAARKGLCHAADRLRMRIGE